MGRLMWEWWSGVGGFGGEAAGEAERSEEGGAKEVGTEWHCESL